MAIVYSFEMDDLRGTFTADGKGTYTLIIDQASPEEGKLGPFTVEELSGDEVASLLYCSFDPSDDFPHEIAEAAQARIPIRMIP